MLKAIATATVLLAAMPAFAQKYDCSKAADPKACEERRQKFRDAAKKAQEACAARPQGERRDCVRAEMCKQSADPAQCEARAKARAEKRKQRLEQHQKK